MTTEHDDLLDLVADTFMGHSIATNLDAVISRGREIRGRRRGLTACIGTGAAALTALTVLAATSASHSAAPALGAGRAGTPTTTSGNPDINIDLAGFSLHSNADSTLTLTFHQLLKDPAAVEKALAEAGVAADVQIHDQPSTHCRLDPAVHTVEGIKRVLEGHQSPNGYTYSINPSAMPHGAVLSFVYYRLPEGGIMAVSENLFGQRPEKCVPIAGPIVSVKVS